MTVSTHKIDGVVKATATVTFSGAPAVAGTIIIIDYAGLSKTYTSASSTTAGSNEFVHNSATNAAAGLKTCIDHASGHNGSITVTNDGAGVLTLRQESTPGLHAAGNTAITETLTNTTATKFTGPTVKRDGGTIAHGGTPADTRFQAKNLVDINVGRNESGSKVALSTGTANIPGIQRAFTTGGTLAYNPNARVVTRSSTDTGFLIRGGTFTKLSGKSGTERFLATPAPVGRSASNIHARQDHRQAGTWATQIFDMFSGVLLQSDGTAKEGITGRGSDSNFIDPLVALGLTQSVDSAVTSKDVSGEFVILTNFTDYTTGDVSGDGAGSSNLMNYSSITG
jgi:hypothetical protein